MATTSVVNSAASSMPPLDPEQQWQAERRTFIGGSEVYELLNIPQYGKGCSRALGYRKLNTEPDYPMDADDAILKRGNILEPIIAALYKEQTGRNLRRPSLNEYGLPKPVRHPEYPWAGVHTDRLILAGSGDVTETGDAEIKSHGEGPFISMLRNGLPPGHGLQVQHSIFVNRHKWGALIVLGVFGGLPIKHFDMVRSDTVIDEIKAKGDAFAEKVWVKGELPDQLPDEKDVRCRTCQYRITCRGEAMDEQAAAMMKAQKEGKVHLVQITDPELATTIANRELLAQEIKAAEEQKALLDDQIKAAMKQHGEAILVGDFKVYCKPMVSNRVDLDALKKAEPELVKKYTKANPGEYYRVYGL